MLTSRVHRVSPRLVADAPRVWLKRDDELALGGPLGATGTKCRKWAAVAQALTARGVRTAVLVGGRRANSIVAGAVVLRERGIAVHVVVPRFGKPSQPEPTNELLWRLVVQPDRVHETDGREAEQLACAADIAATKGPRCVVVPEGACMDEAMPGVVALGLDVAAQLHELRTIDAKDTDEDAQDHVVVEAGTGMTSFGLVLGLDRAPPRPYPRPVVHVVLVGDPDKVTYRARLEEMLVRHGHSNPAEATHAVVLHEPKTARSFGGFNATLRQVVAQWAREGILLDPLYGSKLAFALPDVIQGLAPWRGRVLAVHGGGTHALLGFHQDMWPKALP